ncbi:MAG TPA: ATP-binding protein [Bdellovibrionota bacterium]|jgi:two-component system phosphate regulon sensor histidine kinase PhoR
MPFRISRNKSPYFPKQLFFRFVLQQVLGIVPAVGIVAVCAHLYLIGVLPEAAKQIDRALIFLVIASATIVAAISLWTGYRLVLPLGRILVKARSIQHRDYSAREEETAAVEEPSEWSDLETTLHKIGREMQSKDRSLSREREQVEVVMSALTEAVAAVDKAGTMLFYNSQFALLFGPGRQDARLSDFIRSPDVLEAFRETLKDGSARQISTQLRLKGEAVSRHFALSIAPLRQENDQLYGAIGVFHDLTELRRMDQVRIDFVANVSHELRTPLTAIKGYAETLKEDIPAGDPSRKFLETIERNTDRLIALVHDLLNLSSLESGAEIEREQVQLAELTSRVLGQLESVRAAKRHEISVKIGTPVLCADPKRVEQVLYNLVENAIKYVPAEGKIDVNWEIAEGAARLHVIDNGPGIPSEHHSRVFERFYRVDSARSRDQGGTGLGLAIVKHIMQRHGGNVSVSSGSGGKGTHFTCSFPLDR